MSRRSAHRIVANVIGQPLVIRDVGTWDVFLTVTNDAEAVVQDLVESGLLPVGRQQINHEFDPSDCSGVWDGNQVISDADPGL